MLKHTPPQVIGIASGKGGVGKTTVSINLACALVKLGYKVMLLDADLGLANAQIAMGAHAPFNIGHVLRGEKEFNEIIVDTPQGVRLVPGASGVREIAALDLVEIHGLIQAFSTLTEQVDYLIVDVAAGLSTAVLEFMAACQRRLVVVCDQPSSIADAYGLIKVMSAEMNLDEIYLVPNLVASAAQGKQLHRRLNDVCTRFLGVGLRQLGSIDQDESVLQASRKFASVLDHAPGSAASRVFKNMAEQLVSLPPINEPSGRPQFFMERLLRPGNGA